MDSAFALSMLDGKEAFASFHANYCNRDVLLEADCKRGRGTLSDQQALEVSKAVLGDLELNAIAGLERTQRDEKIRLLRESRLSIRQICRLTGVSRSIVASARTGQ